MEGQSKAPYLPEEEPADSGEEIDLKKLSPEQQGILEVRLSRDPQARPGPEVRAIISEINERALNDNISPEAAAKKILQEEQERR